MISRRLGRTRVDAPSETRQTMSTRPDGVLVLGMHKGGTSAATRLVNMLGPATCEADDMPRGPWNPTGLWESRTLNRLDDKLLAEMGRTWYYPPPVGDTYFALAGNIVTTQAEASRVFNEVHKRRPWVWKDPRACVLLPFWRKALAERVAAIIVLRNPLEVGVSLGRRHNVAVEFGIALWERYSRLLLAHAAGLPVMVSRFDDLMRDPSAWMMRASEFLTQAGVPLQSHSADGKEKEFIDPSRRRSVGSRSELARVAPAGLTVFDELEAQVGSHLNFEPPSLPPEDASVEATLAAFAVEKRLGWRDPPGPVQSVSRHRRARWLPRRRRSRPQ